MAVRVQIDLTLAAMVKRYKKGRPCCGRLLGEKTLKQPFNVGALNSQGACNEV